MLKQLKSTLIFFLAIIWLFGNLLVAPASATATTATLSDLWSGAAHLGPAELVSFTGNPADAAFSDPGRFSVVEGANETLYGYFRQYRPKDGRELFDIYMAISYDRGKTFVVQPQPIIAQSQTVFTAYDPDVIKRSDGYYMVFESFPSGCSTSSSIAFSADGINNWIIEGVPVCSTSGGESASTPTFIEIPNGELYIQWVNVEEYPKMTTRHQAKMDTSNLFETITYNTKDGQLPQSPAGSWDDNNFGAGSAVYENGYYYLLFEGANYYRCAPPAGSGLTSVWGIGFARTNDITNPSSWVKNSQNPLILAQQYDSCWVGYPKIISIDGKYFLYYSDWFTNWNPTGTESIFRREIMFPPDTTPPAAPSGLSVN